MLSFENLMLLSLIHNNDNDNQVLVPKFWVRLLILNRLVSVGHIQPSINSKILGLGMESRSAKCIL